MPKMELSHFGTNKLTIINAGDNDRQFVLDRLPFTSSLEIHIDNKNQIITNNHGLNLYDHFNMNFFRMIRGDNRLIIDGHCRVKFICEFPINVGG